MKVSDYKTNLQSFCTFGKYSKQRQNWNDSPNQIKKFRLRLPNIMQKCKQVPEVSWPTQKWIN